MMSSDSAKKIRSKLHRYDTALTRSKRKPHVEQFDDTIIVLSQQPIQVQQPWALPRQDGVQTLGKPEEDPRMPGNRECDALGREAYGWILG